MAEGAIAEAWRRVATHVAMAPRCRGALGADSYDLYMTGDPRILPPEVVLTACEEYRDALNWYIEQHAAAARRTPELMEGGESLGAATWDVAGHCLSTASATVVLFEAGYGLQADPLIRATWDAAGTLGVLATEDERDLRRIWVQDGTIPHASSARALARLQQQLWESGEVDEGTAIRPVFEELYGQLSGAAHGKRSSIRRSVGSDGFQYGADVGGFTNAWLLIMLGLTLTIVALQLDRGRAYWDVDAQPGYRRFLSAAKRLGREVQRRLDYV